jgi:hypothetical protein
VLTAIGQGFEDRAPTAAFAQAVEAIVDGCVGTYSGWAIAPRGAAVGRLVDATDDAPIVISFRSGQVCWP